MSCVLETTISLTLGAWIAFWLNRDLKVDTLRQEMFALRDRLFDEADRGLIEFSHPAYVMLRTTMNGFIRFAHRLSFLEILLFSLLVHRDSQEERAWKEEWARVSQDLPQATRKRLLVYQRNMHILFLLHVVPMGRMIVTTARVLHVVRKGVVDRLERILGADRVDSVALSAGRGADGALLAA